MQLFSFGFQESGLAVELLSSMDAEESDQELVADVAQWRGTCGSDPCSLK